MIENSNTVLTDELLYNYFSSLVNCFFKILPIRESEEKTLTSYVESLQAELLGCKNVVEAINNDSGFLTLINILQYFMDDPECSVAKTKREVFKAINICNRIKQRFNVDKAV